MKFFATVLLVSLLCFLNSSQAENDHDHESERALTTILTSIMAASNSSMTFNDVNNLANRIVPNRTCASSCSMCSTASYVFNALNLNHTAVIDGHEFANASVIIVYSVIHEGWARVCNSTTNMKPGGYNFHLEQVLHEFGNETANGMNENGIIKLLKEVNEEYGPSHPMTMGRKCFDVESLLEEEGNHTGHHHDHNKYHPATEVMPKLLEKLAQGLCINATKAAAPHAEEDHFHEILEAINATSKVVMTHQDLNTLAMKITSNRKCSNCVGCTIASFVYTSMGLANSQTLNETNFPTAAIVITYALLPEGWALVCNQTAQAKPGSPDSYTHKLLHEFGNETRMQYSTVGIIKMLNEINSTYGLTHPPDGRKCFSATTLVAAKNTTTTDHDDHSGHGHRRRRAADDHDHSSHNITVANNQWYNSSAVFVPLIEKLVKGQCIQAITTTDNHDDHNHGNHTDHVELPEQAFFQRHLFEIYASNGRVNLTGLQNLMTKLNIGSASTTNSSNSGHDDHSGHNHKRFVREVHDDHKFEGKCYTASQIFSIFKIGSVGADPKQFTALSPALVQQVATSACKNTTTTVPNNTTVVPAPSSGEVWGYTMLAVTVITLTSVGGILIIPCLGQNAIRYVIAYLIGLAVGSLVGDGILHLIPHALTEHDHSSHAPTTGGGLNEEQQRLMKMLICLAGVYGFYIFETIMVLLTRKDEKNDAEIGLKTVDGCDNPGFSADDNKNKQLLLSNEGTSNEDDGFISKTGQKVIFCGLTAVGVMVVLGDGFHNFTDGIAIGASFKSSLSLGLSTSIAVFCHELPQELGDFAILYASGMGWKKALIYNLISGLTCYIGAVIGIFAASTDAARQYLFAVTAGLFLYIALVDLLPQLTGQGGTHSHSHSHTHSSEGEHQNIIHGEMNWKKFFSSNIGILTGFTIMFLLAFFEDRIKLN